MKSQNVPKRISPEKKSSNKKEKKLDSYNKKTEEKSKSPKNKSPEKMIIKVDPTISKELAENEEETKPKKQIFNNKKNNGLCSDLLRNSINQEKELILIPYAKEKQKINKTLNTIGNANGISYPTCSVIKGILTQDKNYLAIIRDADKKKNKKKKNKLMSNNIQYKAEINLESDAIDDNNLKEMLGDAENIKDYI
jgi:hypothetical protein